MTELQELVTASPEEFRQALERKGLQSLEDLNALVLLACKNDKLDNFLLLLEHGADLYTHYPEQSPLHACMENSSITVANYLIVYKQFDMNGLDAQGRTPLKVAIEHRDLDMVDYLLRQGADVTRSDAISAAIEAVDGNILRVLIEADAPVIPQHQELLKKLPATGEARYIRSAILKAFSTSLLDTLERRYPPTERWHFLAVLPWAGWLIYYLLYVFFGFQGGLLAASIIAGLFLFLRLGRFLQYKGGRNPFFISFWFAGFGSTLLVELLAVRAGAIPPLTGFWLASALMWALYLRLFTLPLPAVELRRPSEAEYVKIRGRFCYTCQTPKGARASHCSICARCIDRFDHHCPWTGLCIGRTNHPWFIAYLASHALLVSVFGRDLWYGAAAATSPALSALLLGTLVMAGVALFFPGGLLLFHCYFISHNLTTKTVGRYWKTSSNPFDEGFRRNWQKFLTCVEDSPLETMTV